MGSGAGSGVGSGVGSGAGSGAGSSVVMFLGGMVLWTFCEYWFHRYLHWTEGGVGDVDNHRHHHNVGDDDNEIHYTLTESGMVIGALISVWWWLELRIEVLCGFIFAYVVYEWMHLAAHRWPDMEVMGMLEYHRQHHTEEETGVAREADGTGKTGSKFGFTTKFWDWCFGTL